MQCAVVSAAGAGEGPLCADGALDQGVPQKLDHIHQVLTAIFCTVLTPISLCRSQLKMKIYSHAHSLILSLPFYNCCCELLLLVSLSADGQVLERIAVLHLVHRKALHFVPDQPLNASQKEWFSAIRPACSKKFQMKRRGLIQMPMGWPPELDRRLVSSHCCC